MQEVDDNTRTRRAEHPLEVRRYPYGWTITFYDGDGHIRHLVNADSEIQAFRSAYKLARLYRHQPVARVITIKGEYIADLERVLHAYTAD